MTSQPYNSKKKKTKKKNSNLRGAGRPVTTPTLRWLQRGQELRSGLKLLMVAHLKGNSDVSNTRTQEVSQGRSCGNAKQSGKILKLGVQVQAPLLSVTPPPPSYSPESKALSLTTQLSGSPKDELKNFSLPRQQFTPRQMLELEVEIDVRIKHTTGRQCHLAQPANTMKGNVLRR